MRKKKRTKKILYREEVVLKLFPPVTFFCCWLFTSMGLVCEACLYGFVGLFQTATCYEMVKMIHVDRCF